MPYFSWVGVNIVGDWHTGKRFAKSVNHLDTILLKQGIALVKQKPIRWRLLRKSITRTDLFVFFDQLSVLINAGILVPHALSLVADQLHNDRLQEVVHILADAVLAGKSLSVAMMHHKKIFDAMTIQRIKIGEEAGDLPLALQSLCASLETTRTFYNQVRSALIMPLIGVLFFITIAAIIITIVIPQFADLFAAAHQDMPWLTRSMLSISKYFTSRNVLMLAGIGLMVCILMRIYMTQSDTGKQYGVKISMCIPFLGNMVRTRALALFFESLAMLLAGGMRVMPALSVIRHAKQRSFFVYHIVSLESAVNAGCSLSQAMAQQSETLFAPHVIAMVAVGEETGNLAPLLDKIAQYYNDEVKKQLTLCTILLQPLLLLALGLLVVLLVLAVYGPIVNLANGLQI
jgi:type II secretory pathway component PulF